MFISLLEVGDSNVQCPISNKERTSRRWGILAIKFLGNLSIIKQIIKQLRHFEIFLNTGPRGVANVKNRFLLQFIRFQRKFMKTLITLKE